MSQRLFVRVEGPAVPRWLGSDPYWWNVVTTSEVGLGEGWSYVCGDRNSFDNSCFVVAKHRRTGSLYGVKRYGHRPGDKVSLQDKSRGEVFPVVEITISTEAFLS